jgi:hypothetical protein
LVLSQDPKILEPVLPARDVVPERMTTVIDETGAVSVRRFAETSPEYVIKSDIAKVRSDKTAAAAFESLTPGMRKRRQLEAVVEALKADKADARGIKTSAGARTILNAMGEEGGIKGKGQFTATEKKGKAFTKGYNGAPSKGLGNKAMRSEGGMSPSEMAQTLKRKYGIGDGTTGKMWSLLRQDVEGRARLADQLQQAEFELRLFPEPDAQAAVGIQSKTLRESVGLREATVEGLSSLQSRMQAVRNKLSTEQGGGAVKMAQDLRKPENIRGFDEAASQSGQRAIDELPATPEANELDAEIASLSDELVASGIDRETMATITKDADELIKATDRASEAYQQAMLCGLNRGA